MNARTTLRANVLPTSFCASARDPSGSLGGPPAPCLDMVEWEPISIDALRARIEQGCARMTPAQLRLWEAVRIEPEKWQQHPYGDQGNGFWAVGLIGRTVVWFNDIEDGCNRSRFPEHGTLEQDCGHHAGLEMGGQFIWPAR